MASKSGVIPLVRATFGFAPALSSVSTMRSLTFSQASASGVTPCSSAALTFALALMRRSATSTSSQCAAHWRAVAPSPARTLTFTPCLMSVRAGRCVLARHRVEQSRVRRRATRDGCRQQDRKRDEAGQRSGNCDSWCQSPHSVRLRRGILLPIGGVTGLACGADPLGRASHSRRVDSFSAHRDVEVVQARSAPSAASQRRPVSSYLART